MGRFLRLSGRPTDRPAPGGVGVPAPTAGPGMSEDGFRQLIDERGPSAHASRGRSAP